MRKASSRKTPVRAHCPLPELDWSGVRSGLKALSDQLKAQRNTTYEFRVLRLIASLKACECPYLADYAEDRRAGTAGICEASPCPGPSRSHPITKASACGQKEQSRANLSHANDIILGEIARRCSIVNVSDVGCLRPRLLMLHGIDAAHAAVFL